MRRKGRQQRVFSRNSISSCRWENIIQEIISWFVGWRCCLDFRLFHIIWPHWAVSRKKIYFNLLVVLIRSRAFFFKPWQIFVCKLPLWDGVARYYYHTRENLEPLTFPKDWDMHWRAFQWHYRKGSCRTRWTAEFTTSLWSWGLEAQ